jgi:heparin binding hemagglutinin HbhA
MAAETNTKIPAPLYAAAAVGDLAYQRLRKLPATVADLRERVARTDLDTDKLRGIAQRNATALVNGAHSAQERAQAIYTQLVARGEQVVRNRKVIHATIGVEPQDAPTVATAPTAATAPTVATAPAAETKPMAKKATKAAQ